MGIEKQQHEEGAARGSNRRGKPWIKTQPEWERRFWFSDVQTGEDSGPTGMFAPYLQTEGACLPLPVWFPTKEACDEFIRSDILGAGFDDE